MKEAILLRDKKNLFCLEAKVSFEFEFESKISVLQSEANGEKEIEDSHFFSGSKSRISS